MIVQVSEDNHLSYRKQMRSLALMATAISHDQKSPERFLGSSQVTMKRRPIDKASRSNIDCNSPKRGQHSVSSVCEEHEDLQQSIKLQVIPSIVSWTSFSLLEGMTGETIIQSNVFLLWVQFQ